MQANRFDIEFRRHAQLRPPARGANLAAVSVDDAGEIACLWRHDDGAYVVAFGEPGHDALRIEAPRPDIDAIAVWPDRSFVLSSIRQRSSASCFAYDANGRMTASGNAR